MAVYTPVDETTLLALLARYDVGALGHFEGISAGIENTNYFVTCDHTRYVLTLFESMDMAAVDYYLGVTAGLHTATGLCPHPVPRRDGASVSWVSAKPAALVSALPGVSIEAPQPRHCRAIGTAMARMHSALANYPDIDPPDGCDDPRGTLVKRLAAQLSVADQKLAESVLEGRDLERDQQLPGGVIHADLFRDNALFEHQNLSGIIDFYYAHRGPWIYDLAVTVCDWCYMPDRALNQTLALELLNAYQALRPLEKSERAAWPAAIEAAAGRFWLSRLRDLHFPRPGAITRIKDPQPFRDLLTLSRREPGPFADLCR